MKDLSNLCGDTGNALIGGESSSGSNTINHPVTSVGAAPGSMPVNLPHGGPEDTMDSPALEVPAEDKDIYKPKFSSSLTHVSSTWVKAGD